MKNRTTAEASQSDHERVTALNSTQTPEAPSVSVAAHLTYQQQVEYIQHVWQSPAYYGIERWVMIGLLVARMVTPFLFFSTVVLSRCQLQTRKALTDGYCLFRFFLLVVLLFTGRARWRELVAVFLLADLMLSVMSGIVLNRPGLYARPVSPTRSVLMALVNYWEINVAFAIIYLTRSAACDANGPVTQPAQLLYFSAITTTTIGYGDVHPCNSDGYCIGIFHAFTGVLLLTFILSLFVAQIRLEGPFQSVDPVNK